MASHIYFLIISIFLWPNRMGMVDTNPKETDLNMSSLLKYVSKIYDENETFEQNMLTIQSAFCPNQTMCRDDEPLRSEADSTNNSYIDEESMHTDDLIGKTTRLDLLSRLDICCTSCSCDESCFETGDCCLSMILKKNPNKSLSQTEMNVTKAKTGRIIQECIVASSESYINKQTPIKLISYLMVAQCFLDRTNESLVKKCESPDYNIVNEAYPVNSLTSGLSYWNMFCSICNEDADRLERWRKIDIPDIQMPPMSPQTSDFNRTVSRMGKAMFIPPTNISVKSCIRHQDTEGCYKNSSTVDGFNHTYLQEACNRFFSPVLTKSTIYANIFCFLCANTKDVTRKEVTLSGGEKGACNFELAQFSAFDVLLQFKDTRTDSGGTESQAPDADRMFPEIKLNGNLGTICPCVGFFDMYRGACRPLFCAPGDVYMSCKCEPMEDNFNVLLKLKVIPNTILLTTETALKQLRNDVQTAFKAKYKNLIAETVAIFRHGMDPGLYYLHILDVRAVSGYKTKEELKSIIDDFDDSPLFETYSNGEKFKIVATNDVRVWPLWYTEAKAKDISTQTFLQLTYKADIPMPFVMHASKLLYCKQVELSHDEFADDRGEITIAVNPNQPIGQNYEYSPSLREIRICVDDYLSFPSTPASEGYSKRAELVVLYGVIFAYAISTN